MAAPVRIDELSASGSLSAGAAVAVVQGNDTLRTTPRAFITEAESFTQAGTGATARSVQSKGREVFSVMDFGAVGDGSTDDSAAVMACIQAAFAGSDFFYGNKTIHFPAGEYLVTTNNAFGQWTSSPAHRQNVTFSGVGRGGSSIIFRPGGSSAKYLYNGETDGGGAGRDQQLLFVLFEKLAFVMDETGATAGAEINLFKQYPKSGNPNQNFQFRDCYFNGTSLAPTYGGKVMEILGLINGSENLFENCRSLGVKNILYVTNQQAVNSRVIGCDWEQGTGDVYYFSGAGSLQHFGGSVVWNTATLPTTGYIINADATVAGMSGHFLFAGMRVELNDVDARIVNLSGGNNSCRIKFLNCDFDTLGGTGSRVAVSVQPNCAGSVIFDHCSLRPITGGPIQYEFKNGTLNYQYGVQYNGSIELYDCRVPITLLADVSWGTNSFGLFRVRNATLNDAWVPASDPQLVFDCDMTGASGGPIHSPGSKGPQLKTVMGFIHTWPDATFQTDGAGNRLKLPIGSMLKSIKLRKIAFGGSATSYKLAVTNDDGTFTYGFSTAANQSVLHEFTDAAIWRLLTSGVNQIVRVVCTKELAYNTQTGNFTVGQTLTDATTATTAKILSDADGGATGTLTIGFITGGTGAFGVGNIITDPLGGSATAGATTTRQGAGVSQSMATGDIFAVEYY